jgi:hypothetical protein
MFLLKEQCLVEQKVFQFMILRKKTFFNCQNYREYDLGGHFTCEGSILCSNFPFFLRRAVVKKSHKKKPLQEAFFSVLE